MYFDKQSNVSQRNHQKPPKKGPLSLVKTRTNDSFQIDAEPALLLILVNRLCATFDNDVGCPKRRTIHLTFLVDIALRVGGWWLCSIGPAKVRYRYFSEIKEAF